MVTKNWGSVMLGDAQRQPKYNCSPRAFRC